MQNVIYHNRHKEAAIRFWQHKRETMTQKIIYHNHHKAAVIRFWCDNWKDSCEERQRKTDEFWQFFFLYCGNWSSYELIHPVGESQARRSMIAHANSLWWKYKKFVNCTRGYKVNSTLHPSQWGKCMEIVNRTRCNEVISTLTCRPCSHVIKTTSHQSFNSDLDSMFDSI